jgi:hypothetical protein
MVLVCTLSGTVIPILFSLEQMEASKELRDVAYLKSVLEVTDISGLIKLVDLAG